MYEEELDGRVVNALGDRRSKATFAKVGHRMGD
jgi:hypothetical protein